MPYTAVRDTAQAHFGEALGLLNFISESEPNTPLEPTPTHIKTMRGLFYVHLYSCLEKTLTEASRHTIRLVSSRTVKYNHFITPFATVSLYPKLQSFKTCSHSNFHSNSISIFSKLSSTEIATLNDGIFDNNLQNVWTNTILEVMACFGITDFQITPRERTTIDEIVEKRNAVAHGREKASTIGEAQNSIILRQKHDLIKELAERIIDKLENYYTDYDFIKNSVRRHYRTT